MTKDLPVAFQSRGAGKNIGWEVPNFLSRKTADSARGQVFNLDRQKITSLDDIKTMDDLGRVLGESGAHAVAHVELGGGMAGFKSVAEPAFVLWHYGAIEKIRNQWLQTDNGKKWLTANPQGWSRPFLDTHDEVMHDVVDQVTTQRVSRDGTSFQAAAPGPARASRGGPAMAARPATASAPKSRGQLLREDRATAEELCTTGYGNNNGELFNRDVILEAAAGFKDPQARAAGAERTKRKRAAQPTQPWSRS
jgi:hypothetical protein